MMELVERWVGVHHTHLTLSPPPLNSLPISFYLLSLGWVNSLQTAQVLLVGVM